MEQQAFRFKQFSVRHDKCAMRVNTDGVLLGAWQNVEGAKGILDIGTGTGVLALMMAQRNDHAIIDAIDIDKGACEQAQENFSNSPWSGRLTSIHSSLQNYKPDKRYDLIISNPPYFIADLQSLNHKKNIARHGVELSYEALIVNVDRLLSDEGRVLVVIPAFNLAAFEALANAQNLFVNKMTEVNATGEKAPYIVLLELARTEKELVKGAIQIQGSGGEFTEEYKMLTKDFYLKF